MKGTPRLGSQSGDPPAGAAPTPTTGAAAGAGRGHPIPGSRDTPRLFPSLFFFRLQRINIYVILRYFTAALRVITDRMGFHKTVVRASYVRDGCEEGVPPSPSCLLPRIYRDANQQHSISICRWWPGFLSKVHHPPVQSLTPTKVPLWPVLPRECFCSLRLVSSPSY